MSNKLLEESEGSGVLRPPLKWAGGKRWLVPRIDKLFRNSKTRRLVEPFVGGMAIALGLRPELALLSDINPHLINFYSWLSKGLRITVQLDNDKKLYYEHRDRFNALIAKGKSRGKEAASLFYFLNRTGFNGLCRFNASGYFNVPHGRYKKIIYRKDFFDYRELLASWEFRCRDFELLEVEKGDFLYVDPPYDVEFTTYAREGFCWEDQERLALWLSKLKVPIVASNQATQRIMKLYKSLGFTVSTTLAPRLISCTGDRAPAKEMLAIRGI